MSLRVISLSIVLFEYVCKYLYAYKTLIHVTHKGLQLYLQSKLKCQMVNVSKTKQYFQGEIIFLKPTFCGDIQKNLFYGMQ